MLSYDILQQEYYDNLLNIRMLSNNFLYYDFPDNLSEMIKELIEIRKYASKQGGVNFKLTIQD